MRVEGWLVGLCGVALLGAGCTTQVPATEVMVVVEATPAVQARTVLLQIEVSGAPEPEGAYTGTVQSAYGPPPSAIQFPRRVALVPRTETMKRFFQFRAIARDTSGVVASALVRSGYTEHRLLELHVVLDDTPCVPECAGTETCREGRCVPIFIDPGMLPSADGGPDMPGVDAGPPDTGGPETSVDLGMPDLPACTSDAQCMDSNACNGVETCNHGSCVPGTPVSCDDGVACTDDSCTTSSGLCIHMTIDALCSAEPGGWCDGLMGCQYPTCSAKTCAPDATMCLDASCGSDGMCHRVTNCATGTACCAGHCEPIGCNDGNDCTVDACGATGCSNVPAPTGSSCSDGNECTFGDQCIGITCQSFGAYDNLMPCDNGDGCLGDVCVGGTCTSCDDGDDCTHTVCAGTTCMTTGFEAAGTTCLSTPDCSIGSCMGGSCVGSGGPSPCLPPDECCSGRCQPSCF